MAKVYFRRRKGHHDTAGVTRCENTQHSCFCTSQALTQLYTIWTWTTPKQNFPSCMRTEDKQENWLLTRHFFLPLAIAKRKTLHTHWAIARSVTGMRHHLQKSNTKCLILAQIHYSHLTVMTKTTSKGSLAKQQVCTRSVYLLPRVSHQDNNSIFFEQLPAPLFFSTGHTSSYWKATDPQMCCVWFAYLNMQITAKRVIFMLHIFAEKLNVQNVYCNNYWFHGISTKGCKSSK